MVTNSGGSITSDVATLTVTLPPVIVWTNLTGGNASVPANWSPNLVPGPGDDVFITNSGTYSVTIDAGNGSMRSLTFGGLSGRQTLAISNVTLNLNFASSVGGRKSRREVMMRDVKPERRP